MQALIAEKAEIAEETKRRRERFDARELQLDRREESLAELQDDLAQTQQEVMEIRLATEEIYSQLSGALAPASLARSIAQTREKLADQFQMRENQLARQLHELEQIKAEIAEQHEKLIAQRTELDAWIRKRQKAVEEQASRLIAREKELDRQETHFLTREKQWEAERTEYKSEIRRLLHSLRKPEIIAA
jgi:chromosome segregation ATPase